MDMNKLADVFKHMTLEQLREANRLICARINTEHTIRQVQQVRRFQHGDVVQFVLERERRTVKIRIDRLNTKTVSGQETRESGFPGKQWRVSPQLCKLVENKPAPSAGTVLPGHRAAGGFAPSASSALSF